MSGRMIGAKRFLEVRVGSPAELVHNNHFDIYTREHCIACRLEKLTWYFGFLFNLTSVWIGVHYSKRERRFCINIVPCLTFWFTLRGGEAP